ncbi:deoxyribonuclease-2-beta [Rhinatrema bivittatum]|uniref:deoxyribonuclease-2-beta n=1 Tax=Rhinatrema bivittatum TaxID=194408 RepID=UPI00112DB6B0|nr:deoxyribonuclease-2-beta [Rhinatrema bivittatum]
MKPSQTSGFVSRKKEEKERNFSFSNSSICQQEEKMSAGAVWYRLSLLVLMPDVLLWAARISCRNEAGEAVDWFVVYKLPRYTMNASAGSGLDYMYLDPSSRNWELSRHFINTSQSALGQTLDQLYRTYKDQENSTAGAYMIYNDAIPSSKNYSTRRGHTKGILLLDRSQGFWLIHSIPRFPPFPEQGYGYPASGRRNGQTAICVTYTYDQFPEIVTQLLYYNPNVYNCSIPHPFQQALPNLQKMCLGSSLPWITVKHLTKLKSAGGENFLHFAKSHFFVDDIYVAWMAQNLETDLLAESWQLQGQDLPSNCSLPRHVYNVKEIKIPFHSYFYSNYDHSKWCVSWRYEDQWTCIGDLNRATQQTWRSGGFICTQNQNIYKAFRGLVSYYKSCNVTN